MNLANAVARKLAQRSSRRQFFKLLGAGSLGTGLFLTRTDVTLGRGDGMRGLRRWPVQPMRRDRPDLHERGLPVQDLRRGRRLRASVPDLRRVVLLPDLRPHRLPDPLLGVQLPAGVREPELPLLRAAADAVRAATALGRPALHVPAAGRAASVPDLVAQVSRMKP